MKQNSGSDVTQTVQVTLARGRARDDVVESRYDGERRICEKNRKKVETTLSLHVFWAGRGYVTPDQSEWVWGRATKSSPSAARRRAGAARPAPAPVLL